MDHLQVNSCVNDIFQFCRSSLEVDHLLLMFCDVVYIVNDEDDAVSDVRLDRLEDVGDVEDVVI